MSTRHIVGAIFFLIWKYIKRKEKGKKLGLAQSTLSCVALGSCVLRQVLGPTLTFTWWGGEGTVRGKGCSGPTGAVSL